ncbi:MAG: hypothetical protein ACJAWQ_002740, partial [Paraglaciecola sp.]
MRIIHSQTPNPQLTPQLTPQFNTESVQSQIKVLNPQDGSLVGTVANNCVGDV